MGYQKSSKDVRLVVRMARTAAIGLLLVVSLARCGGGGSDFGCATSVVDTTSGLVCGRSVEVVDRQGERAEAFFGIPFAETTAGENRWRPPIAKARMRGVFRAFDRGTSACPQSDPGSKFGATNLSEDCLSLNVWRRPGVDRGALRPVMVWIYGGSFTSGGTNVPVYDGAFLATSEDVVVVTINYRLGALGFLAGIGGLTGNFGLQDQQLALHWVQDNIAGFGGDPDQVTIFGESAGAMSVGLHALSIPSSTGLFRSILMQSNPFGIPYKSLAESESTAKLFAGLVGCPDESLDCMRAVPWETIVMQQSSSALLLNSLLGARLAGFLVFSPLVDGSFLVQEPVDAAQAGGLDLPTLFGTTSGEGIIFVDEIAALEGGVVSDTVYRTVLTLLFGQENADQIIALYGINPSGNNFDNLSAIVTDYLFGCANRFVASQARAPTWAYEFTETAVNVWPNIPQCVNEACHGDDVPFTFHVDRQLDFTFTPEQAGLSDEMVGYWGTFATVLDPNAPGFFAWPSFDPSGLEYMILDTPALSVAVDPYANCDFWDGIGYNETTVHAAMSLAASQAIGG